METQRTLQFSGTLASLRLRQRSGDLALNLQHGLCKWVLVGYLAAMSTVAEVNTAFKQLPEREQWKLTEWIQETLTSFETLDADGAKGREPVSAVTSIVRRVKRERRETYRRS